MPRCNKKNCKKCRNIKRKKCCKRGPTGPTGPAGPSRGVTSRPVLIIKTGSTDAVITPVPSINDNPANSFLLLIGHGTSFLTNINQPHQSDFSFGNENITFSYPFTGIKIHMVNFQLTYTNPTLYSSPPELHFVIFATDTNPSLYSTISDNIIVPRLLTPAGGDEGSINNINKMFTNPVNLIFALYIKATGTLGGQNMPFGINFSGGLIS